MHSLFEMVSVMAGDLRHLNTWIYLLMLYLCFQGVESVKKEIDDLGHTGPYRPPARLRKRTEFSSKGATDDSKVFEANEYVSALCFTLMLRGTRFF